MSSGSDPLTTGGGFKAALAARPQVGTFLKLPRREVVDLLAAAGFDFVICDLEHGQVVEQEAREVILAATARDLPVVIRAGGGDAAVVNRLLEYGAAGVQVPHVSGEQQARAVWRATRYPPDGDRSASLTQPAACYGAVPAPEHLAASNAEIVCVGQLETRSFDGPLDALISALDVAFIGGFDLSVECGVPGQLDHPSVRAVVTEIEQAARGTQTLLGTFAPRPTDARQAIDAGYHYIALGSDLTVLSAGARDLVAAVQG